MATTLAPASERLVDWPTDAGHDAAPQAVHDAVTLAAEHRPALTALAPATHRRRSRWFELNPGCFGRAALLAAVVAGTLATGGLLVWTMRWVRRGRRVVGAVRAVRAVAKGPSSAP